MILGIIGGGVVGRATALAFSRMCEVRVHDTLPERATHTLGDVYGADLIMLCLPTPQEHTGRLDPTYLDNVLCNLPNNNLNLVIRSTVPIGYTKSRSRDFHLPNLCHSPEFLDSATATLDASMPRKLVIGLLRADLQENSSESKLFDLYRQRWPHLSIHRMTSNESEALKLIQNSFFATKVAFWNEAHELCTKMGLDWDTVMGGVLADGRIHPSHIQVPGPDGKFGFGGGCLPKDLSEWVHTLYDHDIAAHVSQGAIEDNLRHRRDS